MSNEAQDKFQKASAVLKIRLEESYQTSFEGLEEPDAKKAKEDADKLSLYRHLMESLKDKFHQSKSYQEKLQILTLSPFTTEETQHFFSTPYCVLCMMQECPGKEGVVNPLISLEELDLSEDITYRQWMTTDRCTLLTVTKSTESFIQSLAEKVVVLTRHHHVAQMQTQYLKKTEGNHSYFRVHHCRRLL